MKTCGECERYFKCKDIDLPEDSIYAEGCPNYTPIDEVITNFEDITSSPRKLAKFINDKINYMFNSVTGVTGAKACPFWQMCAHDDKSCEECITEWLNKPKKKEEVT